MRPCQPGSSVICERAALGCSGGARARARALAWALAMGGMGVIGREGLSALRWAAPRAISASKGRQVGDASGIAHDSAEKTLACTAGQGRRPAGCRNRGLAALVRLSSPGVPFRWELSADPWSPSHTLSPKRLSEIMCAASVQGTSLKPAGRHVMLPALGFLRKHCSQFHLSVREPSHAFCKSVQAP